MTAAQRDLPAMLARAQADLRAAEERVGQLEAKRGEALLEPGHTPAARIDHDLGNERGTIAILRDKIAVLRIELAKQREAAREKAKNEAIAALEERLAKRTEAARNLEAAISQFSAAFVAYRQANSNVFTAWPVNLFGDPTTYEQADGVAVQMGSVLGVQSSAPSVRFAEFADRVGQLAADVSTASQTILAALRRSPLPPEVTELEVAA